MSLPLLLLLQAMLGSALSGDVANGTNNDELQNLKEEVDALKELSKHLSGQLEKWNNLFLHSLEPRMASAAISLANIDSNVNNLQERAHVWDTFQLHVTAWNDQLATLDRKADIISKGQEKILELESKINIVSNIEYKINEALKRFDNLEETISNLKEEAQNQRLLKDHHTLFGEFATRGILSTVKMIEKKLDRLLLSQQSSTVQQKSVEKPRLTIKCNTPPYVEELLNDISSKVDVMFDKIIGKEENESDFGTDEDYLDDGSGIAVSEPKNCSDRKTITTLTELEGDEIKESIEKLLTRAVKIENLSQFISKQQDNNLQKIEQMLQKCVNVNLDSKLEKLINSHVLSQTRYFESLLLNISVSKSEKGENASNELGRQELMKVGCEDLDKNYKSGVYIFGNNSKMNRKKRSYNKRYCLIRNDESWTVIQARGNHPSQNFNLSWFDYKHGFGDLEKDFWFGNDFISKLSSEHDLLLRIELEAFDGRHVWAEFNKFLVLSEEVKYQLTVGGFRGNATDSFLSHNGSVFSTFDQKNDQAPICCPCAVSYGGGWWFNSCFESNLNGLYYNQGENNGHYGGLIWETWLGNRSLKKTLMMVKGLPKHQHSTSWPYYEDP